MNPNQYLCSDLKSYYKNSKRKKVIKSVDFFTKQNLDNYVDSLKHSNARKSKFIYDYNEVSENHQKNAISSFNSVFSNKTINQESPEQIKKTIKLIVQPSIGSNKPQTIDVPSAQNTYNINTIRSPINISDVTIDKDKLIQLNNFDFKENSNLNGKLIHNSSERKYNSIFKTDKKINSPKNIDEELLKVPSSFKFRSVDLKNENIGVVKDYNKIFKKTLDHITDIKIMPKFIDTKLQGETIVTKEEDRKKFAKQNITNERLVKIKDSVYFLKGLIDYCFPKIVIDKLKVISDPKIVNNVSPLSRNLSPKIKHIKKENIIKLGGKSNISEPVLGHSHSTKNHKSLPKIKSPTNMNSVLKVIQPLNIRSIFHE